MLYHIHTLVCACLALGTQVQAIHYRLQDSQVGIYAGIYTTAVGSCPLGYVAISSTSECDAAASALGLSPGPWASVDYGGNCAKWDGGWGPWGADWYWYFAGNQASAELICAPVLGPSPTPSPTATPTASPAFSGAIAATGDPHLQNIHGERFDLMKPGRYVLIQIPRGESVKNTLLRVDAEARRLGGQCSDMYFRSLNVTGAWAEVKQPGGYQYKSQSVVNETPEWISFGKLELKIVHGRTQQGIQYLNFYVKHLGRAGRAVGGLLGEDDHSDVETPPEACVQRISLLAQSADMHNDGSALSVAVASFG